MLLRITDAFDFCLSVGNQCRGLSKRPNFFSFSHSQSLIFPIPTLTLHRSNPHEGDDVSADLRLGLQGLVVAVEGDDVSADLRLGLLVTNDSLAALESSRRLAPELFESEAKVEGTREAPAWTRSIR